MAYSCSQMEADEHTKSPEEREQILTDPKPSPEPEPHRHVATEASRQFGESATNEEQ